MPSYRYRAVDAAGRSIGGTLPAPDDAALESRLKEIGYWLVEAEETEDKTREALAGLGWRRRIKRRDRIEFFIQARALVSAGVPLLDALKTMATQSDNPRLKSMIENIAVNVETGQSLHEAMSAHSDVFSEQILSMIRAGEHSGTLPETFEEIRRYLEWLDKLISDIKHATIYPTFVLSLLFLFIMVLFTFVAPRFILLLVSLKMPLPLPTVVVMKISGFFVTGWWMIILALAVTALAVRIARRRISRFALAFDELKIDLPVFGGLNRMFALSTFARTFATLFRAGIPVLHNLELCEGVVGNKVLENAIRDTAGDVEEGTPMSESMRRHEIFPPMILRMVSVGESTGDLGAAMLSVSDYYNEEIPRKVRKIFSIIEPVVIISLVLIVGFTALSIFLPILSLMGGAA